MKDITVLEFISKNIQEKFEFNEKILEEIVNLGKDVDTLVQILAVILSQYVKRVLAEKKLTLSQISQKINDILTNFKLESQIEENLNDPEELIDKNNKIYTIK